jgi:hypothetical protein
MFQRGDLLMSGWQPDRYDPRQHEQYMQQQYQQPVLYDPRQQRQQPVPYDPRQQQQYDGQDQRPRALDQAVRKTSLTAAEKFWYVLGNIALGAMYFAKIPSKKALADFGLAELTTAEGFWYILMCIPLGAGYFAKIPTAKAISELGQFRAAGHPQLNYSR